MDNRQTILIVDDTPENLRILGDLLEQEYEVRIAVNGADALDKVKSSAPDLILLDIVMPGMGGFEVCRQLKADPDFRMIPVIFISALGMSEHKIQAFRQGAVDYITKPFQADEVVARVRTHLQLSKMEELKREIAERKRAEEEREKLQAQFNQAQKMESVGRLAGGVAHDFNNKLGIILGYTELALEHVDPAHPLHANLQEIRKAASRSADLTRQLLAFARKQTVDPKVLDLNETVESMLKMLRRLIGEDINLAWLPGRNLWSVKVDPSQIDQILANLSVNARDAIAGVGKMTIETGTSTFDSDYCAAHPGFAPGEYVMLAVSDNGCGLDRETLPHIFEPFFTTKEIGKGTGLGLSTVYGIVRQNNGFINVYSEPGQGATFKIYLPRHKSKAALIKTEGPAEPPARGSETILLVEDEPAILKMTTMMLQGLGYTVLASSMPDNAIQMAEAHPGQIHLLMTDVVMPEMNGRDLARNLLSRYPRLKRLFMSGYTANVIAHHGVLEENFHFIQKPFSVKELSDKVREALSQ